MTYSKTEFKKTGIFHIMIGIWILLSALAVYYYMNVGQSGVNIPTIAIGVIYIFLGFKIRKADRTIVIATIFLNLLQVLNFNLEAVEYLFAFGPHIHLDLFNWKLSTGVNFNFWMRIGESFSFNNSYFKVSLINLAIIIYLLDQIRFIPNQIEKPWESEFMK